MVGNVRRADVELVPSPRLHKENQRVFTLPTGVNNPSFRPHSELKAFAP